MNLKDAYIIDGDVIEKQIEMLKEIIGNTEHPNNPILEKASLNTLLSLKQHLKPSLPIVEEAYKMGCYTGLATHAPDTVLYNNHKNEFLTKDF